jgi:uncharacterized protein (TIGR02145 family)
VRTAFTIATGVNAKWGRGEAIAFNDTSYFVTFLKGGDHTGYLYGQRISRSGTLIGSPIQISSNYARETHLAYDGTNYLVAWIDGSSGDEYVYGQFLSKFGVLVGSNFMIDDGSNLSDNPVTVTFDGSRFLVTFHEQGPVSRWNLFARFVTPSGIIDPNRVTIREYTKSPGYPTAAFDGTNYLITWVDDAFSSRSKLMGRFFSTSGIPIENEFIVFNASGTKAPYVGTTTYGNNKYLVVTTRLDTTSLTNGDVYGKFIPAINNSQPPTISSLSPVSGPIGTVVTINGTNFSTTPANNIIYFGAVKATVTAATSTSLSVTVPTGATYQPITVTVNGLTAYSNAPFLVTFEGGGAITANSFSTKVDFATGTNPDRIAIGDIDGDGKPDLVVCNSGSAIVSVFRNTSTSGSITSNSFAAKVDFATGTGSNNVAIGDIDGDGKLDLVVTNANSNTVSVFRNTSTSGSISFAAKVDFVPGNTPYGIAIGDIDSDGKPDLVVVNQISNTVSVFKNTSISGSITSGSFAAKVDFTTGTTPWGVAINDIDGDGKPDLIVTSIISNTVSIFRNTSTFGSITSSSLAAKVDFTTGAGPYDVAISDIDSDGKPDLVVGVYNSNTVSVFRNTSTSGSITFATKVDFAAGARPLGIAINDIDGDGKPDLAIANVNSNTVSVFRNTSTSGSITLTAKVDFVPGTYPTAAILGDIDGDGKPDLVVGNLTSNTVSVLRNTVLSYAQNPCPGTPTVSYLGKIYNTVLIGTQCWLRENLDVGTMITGEKEQLNNGIIEKYCYDNDPNNCATYGGLYQWNEAMQYVTTAATQGICPTGWHIPTSSDFQTLNTTVGYDDMNAFMAVGQLTGTNLSGFSALLAGYYFQGKFGWLGAGTSFWSSLEQSTTNANAFIFTGIMNDDKNFGISIRCLKDETFVSIQGIWDKISGPGDPIRYNFQDDSKVLIHFQTRVDTVDYATFSIPSSDLRGIDLGQNGIVGWRGIYKMSSDYSVLQIEGYWYNGLPPVQTPTSFTEPTTYAKVATTKDIFPLSIGYTWRYNFTNVYTASSVHLIITDTGKLVVSVIGMITTPDSIRWQFRQWRDFIETRYHDPSATKNIKDSTDFELVELKRDLHQLYAPNYHKEGLFPFQRSNADSAKINRYTTQSGVYIRKIYSFFYPLADRYSHDITFCADSGVVKSISDIFSGAGLSSTSSEFYLESFHTTNIYNNENEIPNGGFEVWEDYPDDSNPNNVYQKPDKWLGSLPKSPLTYSFSIEKNRDSYPVGSGQYSMIIKNDLQNGVSGVVMSYDVPPKVDLKVNKPPAFPLSFRPNFLCMYYKYLSVNGDSMTVGCLFFKNGVNIGDATYITSQNVLNWTSLKIPVNFYTTDIPDSATIFLSTSRYIRQDGSKLYVDNLSFDNLITSVPLTSSELPSNYNLSQNYPNPFNPMTNIRFRLPERSIVKLVVYDILGREVSTLVNQELEAGDHEVIFNASNLSSGIYFYRIQSGNFMETKKLILMK